MKCIDCLQSAGYNARASVSDNHPSNVAAYQKLLLKYAMDSNDDLHICVVSYLKFLLLLLLIVFFLIRLLSKVAGKGNTAEISVFYSGRHDTELTPLPRTGMFSKI